MRVPFLDIKAQYTELSTPLDEAVLSVIRSGSYILGSNHAALEREIAELQGCGFGIGLNSGTDALRIMLDAAGVGPGDEVITCAFTFVSSAETIVQSGAIPVFVDVLPETFMMNPTLIEAAITPKTKAIMPIHLFGQIAEMGQIEEIAKRHNLVILEDAAQAIASKRDGKTAGQFGLGAAFSFYVTKNLGAAGDAGMITTNDEEFADRCRSMRIHGMGLERYYYDYVGYTSRLDEIQAAVLRVKLTKLPEWIAARRKLAECYFDRLKGIEGLRLPCVSPLDEHTYHQFTVKCERRDALQAYLKANEIDSMIYYPVPLHFHKPYAKYGGAPGSLQVTERVCTEVLSLPVFEHMSMNQANYVVDTIKKFFDRKEI
jgi:dTDP-4-amino-4,6-dideoxygalactose transaminase